MQVDCALASGSRRSCAALAITNALNAADVVAVVVAPDFQRRVVSAVLKDLEARCGTRVLTAESARLPWLDPMGRGSGDYASLAEPVRRAVLVWQDVDAFLRDESYSLEKAVDGLCRSMGQFSPTSPTPHAFNRAVLIGGEQLLERLDDVAGAVPAHVRFRYILVQ